MEVFCREIRPEVGAMSPDGPILHQTVFQENLLPSKDVFAGEDRSPDGLTTFSGMGGASSWALMAIQIKTENPITRTRMTEFLHQGESLS